MGAISDLGRLAFRKWVTDGVPSSGAHDPDKDEIFDFVDEIDKRVIAQTTTSSFVGVSVGQSNPALRLTLSGWQQPGNLKVWNSTAHSPGTAFGDVSGTIRVGDACYAKMARRNPALPVYTCTVAEGSQPIAQWLPDPPVNETRFDMFAALDDAVTTLLAQPELEGKTTIDHLLWWQGESDSDPFVQNLNYVGDWTDVFLRLLINASWFDRRTKITVVGLSEHYFDGDDTRMKNFNHQLRRVVSLEPMFRSYVDTRLLSQNYWDAASDYLHASPQGLLAIGEMAYDAAFDGDGRINGPDFVVPKRFAQTMESTTTQAIDDELRVWLVQGKSYECTLEIIGLTGADADFKWALVGPDATLIQGEVDYIKNDAANTRNPQFFQGSSYPTGQTVLVGANGTNFRVTCKFLVSSVAESGLLSLRWAQNSSSAGLTYVLEGSKLSARELP